MLRSIFGVVVFNEDMTLSFALSFEIRHRYSCVIRLARCIASHQEECRGSVLCDFANLTSPSSVAGLVCTCCMSTGM